MYLEIGRAHPKEMRDGLCKEKTFDGYTLFEFEISSPSERPSSLLRLRPPPHPWNNSRIYQSFIAGNCDFLTCPPPRPKAMWRRSQTARTIFENANMSNFFENSSKEWRIQRRQWQLHPAVNFTTKLHKWKVPGGLRRAPQVETQASCQNHKEMNRCASEDYS